MTTMTDRYRRWYEYEKDCNAKLLASLATVPEGRRGEAGYQRAANLLSHLILARWTWAYRLGVAASPVQLFDDAAVVAELPGRFAAVEEVWTGYLAKLTDADLERVFEYQAFDGGRYRNRVEDILTQLHGHTLHHRGHFAALVRELGGEPVPTDFVFWTREPI